AEDGIRYSSVTGVQTCALPIFQWIQGGMPWRGLWKARRSMRLQIVHCGLSERFSLRDPVARCGGRSVRRSLGPGGVQQEIKEVRSEERRVGEGGMVGWWWSVMR